MAKNISEIVNMANEASVRAVPVTSQNITVEKLKKFMPKGSSTSITQEVVDLVNSMGADTGLPQELLEEDFMSYLSVLTTSRISAPDYINAVKYCNLKRNMSNKEAWAIVFPHRYDKLIEEGRQVDSHVSMFDKCKAVVAIDKELLIPIYLQYAGYFHAAVKKQFDLMNGIAPKDKNGKDAFVSPMVQHLAAKELSALTRMPEENKLSITVNQGEITMNAMKTMTEQLAALSAKQHTRLKNGEDIIDVQQIGIDFNNIGVDTYE